MNTMNRLGMRGAGRGRAPPSAQINVSPHAGAVDLSVLNVADRATAVLDPVSVADLLRNAFVYPPHSIFQDVKVVGTGFDPQQDMRDDPSFRFAYQSSASASRPPSDSANDRSLLEAYHRRLCEAVARSTKPLQSPWLLQSGGKDSTSIAIAAAEACPQVICLTYLGGAEENELDSARSVARRLGLRHESLTCDPGRAYDRYLAMVPRMPLLTGDFAVLSYVDLATEIRAGGGDGIIDGLGSDSYFGTPVHWRQRVLTRLARGMRLPSAVFALPLVRDSFPMCFALATLEMDRFERSFPGSRFSDAEVDALFGQPVSAHSRLRLAPYRHDIAVASSAEAVRRLAIALAEESAFAKGLHVASALALALVFPFCDAALRDWVFNEVPDRWLIGPGGENKRLVRRHIAQHFRQLPYVTAKGSFRFDLCGLARARFDQVHAFARLAGDRLPGAAAWLEGHRDRLGNKYFASKFYLLAIVLPWLLSHPLGDLPVDVLEPAS